MICGSAATRVHDSCGSGDLILNLDVDSDGRIIGLEVLDASRRLSTALVADRG